MATSFSTLNWNVEKAQHPNFDSAVAEHLELKYSRGKRYADSAEAFIDRLARKSSWSGEPYQLICDGETRPPATG